MTEPQSQRPPTGRRAREAAAAAARKKTARRRWMAGGALVAVIAVALVVMAATGTDDDTTDVATGSTTTTAGSDASDAPAGSDGSAAGKPCLAATEAPPAGAPAVPVKEGPPPAQLVKEDLKPGTGPVVTPGATVTVNYIGVACSTGKIFDSSYSRGEPVTFSLNEVIPGWQEGIPGMSVGGQRLLGIPPDQAYGPSGQPPDIAPSETLWFVVEVLETKAA